MAARLNSKPDDLHSTSKEDRRNAVDIATKELTKTSPNRMKITITEPGEENRVTFAESVYSPRASMQARRGTMCEQPCEENTLQLPRSQSGDSIFYKDTTHHTDEPEIPSVRRAKSLCINKRLRVDRSHSFVDSLPNKFRTTRDSLQISQPAHRRWLRNLTDLDLEDIPEGRKSQQFKARDSLLITQPAHRRNTAEESGDLENGDDIQHTGGHKSVMFAARTSEVRKSPHFKARDSLQITQPASRSNAAEESGVENDDRQQTGGHNPMMFAPRTFSPRSFPESSPKVPLAQDGVKIPGLAQSVGSVDEEIIANLSSAWYWTGYYAGRRHRLSDE